MNIEEKYERMLKLKNKPYLEDSEYAELETLESEFEELNKDRRIPEPKEIPLSKKQKALKALKNMITGTPNKPATMDEIRQLELEFRKARLNRAIRITKMTTPSRVDKAFKALGIMAHEINKDVIQPPRKKPISNKPKDDWWSKDKWNIKL